MSNDYILLNRTGEPALGELAVRLRAVAEVLKHLSTDSANFSKDMQRLQTELRAVTAQLRALDR